MYILVYTRPMKKTKQPRALQKLSPEQIVQFLDEYASVVNSIDSKSKLISLRVPENILSVFKFKSREKNMKYQSQIVALMRKWITENS